jgi:hypothetical protein
MEDVEILTTIHIFQCQAVNKPNDKEYVMGQ